jgi:hypothetical protein
MEEIIRFTYIHERKHVLTQYITNDACFKKSMRHFKKN